MTIAIPLRGNRYFPQIARRDSFAQRFREKVPVTVCIGVRFAWNYAPKGLPEELGHVGLCASDRMLTNVDTQWEPQQQKIGVLNDRIALLVSGDMSIHSQALRSALDQIKKNPDIMPLDAALTYGRAIQAVKRRQAEDIILSPLGLNFDTFLSQTKDLSDSFVNMVTGQLQDFRGEEVEALVVGSDKINARIYSVSTQGIVNTLDDIGFGAIGIGGWHARSSLQQAKYQHSYRFAPALAAVFAAKKAAEVAPGVGSMTDLNLVFKNSVERLRSDVESELEKIYFDFIARRTDLVSKAMQDLQTFIESTDQIASVESHGQSKDLTGGHAPVDGSAGSNASEASRGHENQKAYDDEDQQ